MRQEKNNATPPSEPAEPSPEELLVQKVLSAMLSPFQPCRPDDPHAEAFFTGEGGEMARTIGNFTEENIAWFLLSEGYTFSLIGQHYLWTMKRK